MATRPKGFGMTAELSKKRAEKFDPADAIEALDWIAVVLERANADAALVASLRVPIKLPTDVQGPLKDGVVLCHLINAIKPGSITSKITASKMPFKQMEMIGKFLSACEGVGCNKMDMFQTVDLFEAQNIPQVVNGIFALGRKAKKAGYTGPVIGPEEATEHKREFTEEQLRAGEGVIGLQAGSNKGASQAGQNFGKTRAIID